MHYCWLNRLLSAFSVRTSKHLIWVLFFGGLWWADCFGEKEKASTRQLVRWRGAGDRYLLRYGQTWKPQNVITVKRCRVPFLSCPTHWRRVAVSAHGVEHMCVSQQNGHLTVNVRAVVLGVRLRYWIVWFNGFDSGWSWRFTEESSHIPS